MFARFIRMVICNTKMVNCFLVFVVISLLTYFVVFSNFLSKLQSTKVITPEGLKTRGSNFTLRGKPFRIRSGSIHYFRVPHQEWGDRLMKLKSMGLNTVDVYIPWNLHEPTPGKYIFDDQHISIVGFLDLIHIYKLYAIIRPGPYICSEWDLGGLPSWLLRDKNMKLRSMYSGFINPVTKYFDELLPQLRPFQYSYGGPIIALQIENEYGVYGNDSGYMEYLKILFLKHRMTELLFVSDNEDGLGKYKLNGVLQTVNFMSKNAKSMVEKLLKFQPNKPIFVTEFWDGWFDHWGEKHHTVDVTEIMKTLKYIIDNSGSFNLYMWHGGTNFGFMNGANANDDGSNYQSGVTSYDYDAPLSETGEIQPKYERLQEYIGKVFPDSFRKDLSSYTTGFSVYGDIELKQYISIDGIISASHIKGIKQKYISSMELLPINEGGGQSYGYIIYQTTVKDSGKILEITDAKDYVIVMLNRIVVYKGLNRHREIKVELEGRFKRNSNNLLQILVENCGRVNYGMDINKQRKGILGPVFLDKVKLINWEIFPLEFKSEWVEELTNNHFAWQKFKGTKHSEEMRIPTIYKGILYVHSFPRRTFIKLPGWFKGVVFVNGFNVGRYWNIGPQKTLFVPAERLRMKDNIVVVFDLQGTSKKYGDNKYPTVFSTEKQDLGDKDSVSFLI